jgi:hypothetical protein
MCELALMETRIDISFQQLPTSFSCRAKKRVGIYRGTGMLGAVKNLQEHEIKGDEVNYKDLDAIYNNEYL